MKQQARVLIVDDKEAVRESLQLILSDFDCAFSEAEDGAGALRLLKTKEFDVAFLDLRLPDQSGIDVMRAARERLSISAKFIIVTGLPDSQSMEEAKELGVFRYLTKPLNYEEIRTVFYEATSIPPRTDHLNYISVKAAPPSHNETFQRLPENLPCVLVLDDDSEWLNIIQGSLRTVFRLSLTTEASDALRQVAREAFDLVILDMKLSGGVSGLDVLSQMRQIRPDLRAIILTGYPDWDLANESWDRGALAYVPKTNLTSLADRANKIIARSKPPVRVFLSYSVNDRPKVLELYNELVSRGFAPWMDIKSILPGEEWEYAIRKGIEKADYFIFSLTRDSQRKEGVIRKEVRQALEHQRGLLEESIFFIGVRLEPCSVSEPFNRYQYVDLFEPDGLPRLLTALSSGR